MGSALASREPSELAGTLTSDVDPDALSELETDYAALGLATEIDLCPYTQPAAFALLAKRGYRVVAFSNTYWLELADQALPAPPPSPAHVRQPHEHERDVFVHRSIAGFAAQPNPRSHELLTALARSACSPRPLSQFKPNVAAGQLKREPATLGECACARYQRGPDPSTESGERRSGLEVLRRRV